MQVNIYQPINFNTQKSGSGTNEHMYENNVKIVPILKILDI